MPFLTTNTEGSGTLLTLATAGAQTTLLANVFFVGTGSATTFSITAASNSLIVAGSLYNTGTGRAVLVDNTGRTDIVVQQTGLISGESGNAIGSIAGGVLHVTNHGIIQSRDVSAINAAGQLILFNTGFLGALNSTTALLLGVSNDSIVNTGTIFGSISMSNGFNRIDTHLGQVTGTIFGGVDDDSYVIRGTERLSDSGGTDSVISHGDYNLAIGLEYLELAGDAQFGGGNDLNNTLIANTLASRLNGRGGDDLIFGQSDDDVAFGGAGNDLIVLNGGNNQAFGGAGDDTIEAGRDAEILNGESGVDTLLLTASADNMTVNLATGAVSGGFVEGDTIRGFENVTGGVGNDVLTGSGADNLLIGSSGGDVLIGGGGNDTLEGGSGADALDGGSGVDTIMFVSTGLAVTVDLTLGVGTGNQAAGDTYVSIENVIGGSGADTLIGSGLGNRLQGGSGADTLSGRGGNDVLEGGGTSDILTGGAGADVFLFADVFEGLSGNWDSDTITDFQDGQDRISFVGDSGVSGMGSLSFATDGADTVITTTSGDSIRLSGIALSAIDASDFIFG